MSTSDKVNLIAAYHFVEGGLLLLVAGSVVVLPVAAVLLEENEYLARLPGWFLGSALLIVAGLMVVTAAIDLALGWGLWQLRSWGRTGAMIVAVLRLPVVPLGTIAGGIVLYILLQDRSRFLFLESAAT